MAKELHREILELKKEVLDMGNLALEMLEDSMKALMELDVELAKTTEKKKHKIREYDSIIEERTLKAMTLFQPMARDVRTIGAILKIITYLARIGRYGKSIASVVEELSQHPFQKKLVNLTHIWEHVREMISLALEAFDKADKSLLEDFEVRDDEVDELRWSIFRECITYMMEEPKSITPCAHYMMIARYLERCGDHACKMAEKVWYMVTSEHVEIS